ncbi:MAG TPA: hypothetical protein VGD27_07260 [Longimicrobiales bacterium]
MLEGNAVLQRLRAAAVILPALCSACGETPFVCTDIPRWALEVVVLDAEAGAPAAAGASIIAVNGSYYDSVFVSPETNPASTSRVIVATDGQAGSYTLRVRKAGYAPVQQNVSVPGGQCGAETTEVMVYLFASTDQ